MILLGINVVEKKRFILLEKYGKFIIKINVLGPEYTIFERAIFFFF